jgi:ferric-dicitrate binding protein FerR (iron transport regulator)
MTERTRYAALAARVLRERPAAKESRLSRDVGISVVTHAIELGQRRRRNVRNVGVALGLLAAAAVALSVGVRHTGPFAACRAATCAGGAPEARELHRHGLDVGQSIVTPAGAPTSVVLASGTQIALDEKSTLECREDAATQRFALLRGGAHLHVSKLSNGQRFVVETPNAEVEVRGTVFDVHVEPETAACQARTTVTVEEGRVEVRAGGATSSLLRGAHWTSACSPPAADAASEPPKLRAEAPSSATLAPGARTSSPRALNGPRHPSSLSEQNDLYARAEVARRSGRTSEALAAYSHLLALFPNGQLAESALVRRTRLLSESDRQGASAEAERYLSRYPTGFARAEMEALTTTP